MRVIDGFISRKELIDALIVWRDQDVYSKKRWFCEKWVRTVGINVLIMAVKNFPAADAMKQVHAWWIVKEDGQFCNVMCSHCGKGYACHYGMLQLQQFGYCPNCGAKMDKIKNT